jgi:hypothetical protein
MKIIFAASSLLLIATILAPAFVQGQDGLLRLGLHKAAAQYSKAASTRPYLQSATNGDDVPLVNYLDAQVTLSVLGIVADTCSDSRVHLL